MDQHGLQGLILVTVELKNNLEIGMCMDMDMDMDMDNGK
jgi:hypothetical protein